MICDYALTALIRYLTEYGDYTGAEIARQRKDYYGLHVIPRRRKECQEKME